MKVATAAARNAMAFGHRDGRRSVAGWQAFPVCGAADAGAADFLR
jgi:hypothetical protein